MKSLDIFGVPIPSFNLKGKMTVQTGIGGVVSFFIMLIMVLYASLKFIHLIEKENPNVSESHIPNYYGIDDEINLSEIDFHFAFSMEGVLSNESKINA